MSPALTTAAPMLRRSSSSASPKNPRYLTPSCQRIVFEDFSDLNRPSVIVRTWLADPSILPSISEHLCHEVALTPAGLYTDMASVIARYIWLANRGVDAALPAIKVCNLTVTKTYIITVPPEREGQWLEMEAVTDVSEYSSGDLLDATITCHFRSIQPDGTRINDLASCTVVYEVGFAWLNSWSRQTPGILAAISKLHASGEANTGDVIKMKRKEAYELFKSFVDYGPRYQNMAEVFVDTKTLEATATHEFQPDPEVDYTGPFYHDGSCHLSGFVVNAIEDREKNAYISQGLEAMKISSRFNPEVPGADIKTYVCMKPFPNDKTVMCGDVYILQDNEIVGVWEGIKFKRIPKKLLSVFLPKPKRRT